MPLALNDVLLVSLRGRCFGQDIILSHTYFVTTPPAGAPTTMDSLLATVNEVLNVAPASLANTYRACLPTSYQLLETRAQRISPVRSAYRSQATVNAFGTHVDPATVANDSAAITMRTDFPGRDQVGTKHIGPIPDAVSVAGLLIAGYKATLQSLATALLTPIVLPAGGGTLTPCVFNQPTNTVTAVTASAIGEQSRVQRRRTVGLGK